MQAENTWNVSSQSKKRAYLGSNPSGSGASSAPKRFKLLCWNCGEEGHGLRDCKEEWNEANIKKNKQKFQALKRKHDTTKGKSNGKSGDKPKRKTGADGNPYVLNKKGVYVLDQKSLSSEKKKVEAQQEFESTMDALEKAAAPAAAPAEPTAQVNVASHVRTPGLHAQMSTLRAAAKKLIP
jgi:Zinc knuckle